MDNSGHSLQFKWTGSDLQFYIDRQGPFFSTANFQAGVSTLYNKCTSWGVTPPSNSPTDIANTIDQIISNHRNQAYSEGYAAGVVAGQGSVAGSYRLDFRVNAHDESVNQWIRYRDWITLDIQSNGTASLGSYSFMNAQIRNEYGEYCNITKN